MKKKFIALILASFMTFNLGITNIFAQNYYQENTYIHNLSDNSPLDYNYSITPFGANPPVNNASEFDISRGDYNYQVDFVGYAVYTDKWIKGSTSMNVSIGEIEVYSNPQSQQVYKSVTVSIYNSKGKQVGNSQTLKSGETKTFSGLSKSEKYYVRFQVTANSVLYQFSGTIS